MVQPKQELQGKKTYDFTVNILSGSLAGRQFTGFFTYDPSTLQGEGEETILAEEVQFNYLSQYTRQKQHARLAFKNGTFQRMIWVDGKKTERFGFNAGFNRWQFGRPSENFIRQGQDYFGYLNPRTLVDGAGRVSYTLREQVLSRDSHSEGLRDRKAPKSPEQTEELETVTEASSGVLLRCEKISRKLRIRVISEGYNPELNVQFPRSWREEEATYVVDEVELVSDRKFYRPLGNIRRLVSPKKLPLVKATGSWQDLETTNTVGKGVLIQCISKGKKLRAQVVSEGYNQDYNVRFPQSIRAEGIFYVVDQVEEASQGGYYLAYGQVRRLVDS
ncbi:hypothetical protein [Roseofilum capinflatum]|uniref:Uncharacterized protein n=1 Tax=Roseofilum capinflatum BLCC-M114 TaxID=3022440 RepID=A0ABT7B9J0_9CYAN|nr:hypothetical protein [Roseofilum capinflatum]MDJ1175775.1 hypothetical protein [Roseofilum capinflatum BLCC-M114]